MNLDIVITQLLEYGLLGTLVILEGVVIFFLYKENKEVKKNWIKDMKEIWQENMKLNVQLKDRIEIFQNMLGGKK